MIYLPQSRRQFLKLLGTGAAMPVLLSGWSPFPAVGAAAQSPDALRPFAAQLHIHGHSHHSSGSHVDGAGVPPRLQWHTDWADDIGLDVLWWSEHDKFFYADTDFILPLETGTLDPATWSVSGLSNPFKKLTDHSWYAAGMQAVVKGEGEATAALTGGELGWRLTAGEASASFEYAPRDERGRRVPGYFLPRSLLSDVTLTLDIWRGAVGEQQQVRIIVELAWSRARRGGNAETSYQEIVYEVVAEAGQPVSSNVRQAIIPVVVPAADTWTQLVLPISQDAQQWLLAGLDNTIQDLRFQIVATNGSTAEMKIRNLVLHSAQSDGPANWLAGKQMAEQYMEDYPGLTIHYGVELSQEGSPHMSVFLHEAENQLPPPELLPAPLVEWTHAHNGLISFNHPLGATNSLSSEQEQEQKFIEVATRLLDVGAYGADFIEVYNVRGGCDLQRHLRLWDTLTANGYLLYGIGTTDSHGGPWLEEENYFVTWIWAASPQRDDLLAGMASGAVYFGNPFRFRGAALVCAAGEGQTGSIVPTKTDQTRLTVGINGDRPNWVRRLRHYLIQPGLNLVSLVGSSEQPWITFTDDALSVDTRQDSFVRVEVWDTVDNTPVAFGQPIALLRSELTPTDGLSRRYLPLVRK